jgi:hypothetical protein
MASIQDGLKKDQTFGDLAQLIVDLFLTNQVPEVRTQDPHLPKHLQHNSNIPGKSYGFADILNANLRKRGIPGAPSKVSDILMYQTIMETTPMPYCTSHWTKIFP